MSTPADVELVQRVLRDTGVDQTVPPPSWSGYLYALARALVDALSDRVPRLRGLTTLPGLLGPISTVALAVLVAMIVIVLVRVAVTARRRRRAARASGSSAVPPRPLAPSVERDALAWRAEIDRRLAAGDLAGALEAVWWWFARRLSARAVDPAWTSGELLVRSGRRDLAPLANRLDRLLYGPVRPAPDDVRRFVARGEGALP